jgi:hypothetical protein
MGCLGVHFAITEDQATALVIAHNDEALMAIVREIEETDWEESKKTGLLAETDKAWDAIHRTLTNGELSWDGGEEPLKWVILGGRNLYSGDDYIICLLNPAQVNAVAAEIGGIDEADFRKRYHSLEFPKYQGEKDEDDVTYTWHWFQRLQPFFQKAAKAGRHVIFTVDQ